MDADSEHDRMQAEWIALDDAMMCSGMALQGALPWHCEHPDVAAAWDALTRPQNLSDLENRLAAYDDGRDMNHWAETVTRKAIAVSRARGSA
jgi:hypothetical protein